MEPSLASAPNSTKPVRPTLAVGAVPTLNLGDLSPDGVGSWVTTRLAPAR
jgi:hypothetical protein